MTGSEGSFVTARDSISTYHFDKLDPTTYVFKHRIDSWSEKQVLRLEDPEFFDKLERIFSSMRAPDLVEGHVAPTECVAPTEYTLRQQSN